MIEFKIANDEDIERMTSSRMEVLREVFHLDERYHFSGKMESCIRDYFMNGDQTTVLAMDDKKVVGCASMCYFRVMPTISHPTGKRAHLMNVYTITDFRRQGIARKMVSMLIEDAWARGATEISLDATEAGRQLYKSLGFVASEECMVLVRE